MAVQVRVVPGRTARRKLTFISALELLAGGRPSPVAQVMDDAPMAESHKAERNPPCSIPIGLVNRSSTFMVQVVRPGTDLSVQVSPSVRSHGGGTWGRSGTTRAWHDAPMSDVHGTPGGSTLLEMIQELEQSGYTGQFSVSQESKLRCLSCDTEVEPEGIEPESILRVEGVSDPDDMAAVAALTCPNCSAKGTVVLKYGPEASPEDAHVLSALGPGPTT